MKNLSEYYGKTLNLVQPSLFKSNYLLKDGEDIVSRLYYPKFFSSNCVVEFGELIWNIKKGSFWRGDVFVYEPGKEDHICKVQTKLFGFTTIELKRGEKMLVKFGVFKGGIKILTELENPLITIKRKFSFKDRAVVTIEQKNKLIEENPWVIMLVWHIELERRRRSHAA